ncbi:proline-rich protein 5-like isoform X3 [Corythoichthys intestinalis]|uniref:proline-rich protein 5-like isoform X3 n=1 Tax=Corythoichthys intestinalis TaxID=161448 RepID=UPI0025A616DF|nr:proline-rich protein 5-like isoform X3 [Corythoichthys intestinalis]
MKSERQDGQDSEELSCNSLTSPSACNWSLSSQRLTAGSATVFPELVVSGCASFRSGGGFSRILDFFSPSCHLDVLDGIVPALEASLHEFPGSFRPEPLPSRPASVQQRPLERRPIGSDESLQGRSSPAERTLRAQRKRQATPEERDGLLRQRLLAGAEERLEAVAQVWWRFFTETLPTLQAIFYPVQGRELSVRQMALLSFRDSVLLKLPLEDSLAGAGVVPAAVTHMLLVLQGVRGCGAASDWRYRHLERLAAAVVSPYLSHVVPDEPSEFCGGGGSQPDMCSSLAPLVEHEGEAYLEKAGGLRRHTVANAHSDARLLAEGRAAARPGGRLGRRADSEDSRR